jgi:hypothetical protein
MRQCAVCPLWVLDATELNASLSSVCPVRHVPPRKCGTTACKAEVASFLIGNIRHLLPKEARGVGLSNEMSEQSSR